MTKFPTLVLLAMTVALTACKDPFGQELQQHGYTVFLTIRGENPAGQIWAFSGNTEEVPPLRGLSDCFPGLQPHDVPIVLPAEAKNSQLSISAQVKYMPPAPSPNAAAAGAATPTVAAGLNFTQTKDVKISIGNATSSELDAGNLTDYLSSHPVSAGCLADLKNPNNQIMLAGVRVDSLTYTLESKTSVNPTADLNLLKGALTASGNVTFSSDNSQTLTTTSPIYVAYKAYKFEQLSPTEGGGRNGALALPAEGELAKPLPKASFRIVSVPQQKRVLK